jgi:inorganic pyrophosphatase
MRDNGEADDKIIAVAAGDPSVSHYNNIEELPLHIIQEVHSFFEDYKKLEEKEIVVENFLGKDIAMQIINDASMLYKDKFRGGR